ncbi:hypothetical protein H9P43_009215 [Blastocladiella emersonii ATCC 22665]|nr:hypothetical protein H9P43_009215 [Blastocladiella emersonii ATCC 22665]
MTATIDPAPASMAKPEATTTAAAPDAAPKAKGMQKMVAGIAYPRDASASYVVSVATLLWVRAAILAFCVFITVAGFVRWMRDGEGTLADLRWAFMFTHINYFFIMGYLVLSILITRRALPSGLTDEAVMSRFTAVVHSTLYSWMCCFQHIVTIVYWLFLSKGFFESTSTLGRTVSVSQHGISLLTVYVEIVLGAMHINVWAIVPALVLIVVYTGWAFLYYFMCSGAGDACTASPWVYGFLDVSKPAAAYMYPGVLLATFFFFAFAVGLHRVRDRAYAGRALRVPGAEGKAASAA